MSFAVLINRIMICKIEYLYDLDQSLLKDFRNNFSYNFHILTWLLETLLASVV